ncbi:MFS transporter [Microbacterium sp. NPDC096154]|uniref:MFS transporter n=1 Tax=Microbacterium sp. NPDC096154 TaxID=3155549 RepID=UPI00331C3BB6
MTSAVTPAQTPKKAALASFLGSTLEYYDFFIYGTAAALVFPALFFPTSNPTIGLVSSFATFGVAYIARPLGGLVMGHFGDRIGRKRVLMLTIMFMGIASLGIGLLPTYDAIGVWAPILLTFGRLLQGFSAGAESAGASTLTLEHSPVGKRGFFTSFVMGGYAMGMVLSTLVFVPITALPEEALFSWGWRIPFLLSVFVLIIAYWVRTHLDETPAITEAQKVGKTQKVPLREVLRFQSVDVVRVLFLSTFSAMQTLFTVFGLSYATEQAGFDRGAILAINATAVGLSMIAMPLAANWSDRVGRKPVMGIAIGGGIASLFLYFLALTTGNLFLVFGASFLFMTVFYSGYNGLWPAFFAEHFATPIRYSGMALGNQLGLIVAGFAPTIGGLLMGEGTWGWIPVALFGLGTAVLAFITLLTSRETAFTPIAELGEPYLRAELRSAASEKVTLP